jgi:hypothetical protein
MTVTFTPSSSVTGTWTANPFSLCNPGLQLSDPAAAFDYSVRGTWSGDYRLIGDTVLTFEVTNPNGLVFDYGRTCEVEAIGSGLQVTETSSSPSSVIVLKRVR